jgi:nuclear cap-binding protein subunit 1
MIVEVMFASQFRLPDPPMIDMAYATIFIELCKLQPSNMPQVLALATELLFERLDTMTKPAVDRFINWFAHHLSNFQFRWSWDEWADCLTQGGIVKLKFYTLLIFL